MITDKIKLTREQDRRCKLSLEDIEMIKHLYQTGMAKRAIARTFNVSQKLIQLYTNPEIKRRNDLRIKNNWKKYYIKQEHTMAMANTRAYKRSLYHVQKEK